MTAFPAGVATDTTTLLAASKLDSKSSTLIANIPRTSDNPHLITLQPTSPPVRPVHGTPSEADFIPFANFSIHLIQ